MYIPIHTFTYTINLTSLCHPHQHNIIALTTIVNTFLCVELFINNNLIYMRAHCKYFAHL